MEKALILYNKHTEFNFSDNVSIREGLTRAGYELTLKHIDSYYLEMETDNVNSYDLIIFSPLSSAIWNSSKNRAKTYEYIFENSQDNSIVMFACDITYGIDGRMWDKGETSNEHKRNVINSKPILIIGSFVEEIKDNPEAMKLLKTKWMKYLHPDSKLEFAEWITFNIYNWTPSQASENLMDLFNDKIYTNMYYGQKKSKLKKSLIRMGLSDEDLVLGPISEMFPNSQHDNTLKSGEWIKYISKSKNILFPYEPIKCDYQVTLRCLEANYFYKDKVKIDNQVSEHIKKHILDKNEWYITADKNVEKLRILLNNYKENKL